MKKFLIFTALFLINTSCSQNFSLTEKTITKYQNDDLKTFITKRFIEISGLNGELSKLNIFLDKILPKQNSNHPSTAEMEKFRKENFIYKAYYSSNIAYLLMPREDLALFCKSTGGELFLTEKFSRNFVRSQRLVAIENQIKSGNIVDQNQIREFDYYSGANTAVIMTPKNQTTFSPI